MREGCELVNSKRVKHLNLNYIVRKLWECRFKNGDDCLNCSDLKECVRAYDARCGLGLANSKYDDYAIKNFFEEVTNAKSTPNKLSGNNREMGK